MRYVCSSIVVLVSMVVLASVLLFFFSLNTSAVADTVCHTIDSVRETPKSVSGYALPFSYVTTSPARILSVLCEGGTTGRVVAGVRGSNTTYVYEYGYHRVGNTWRKIAFSGETRIGGWYVGTAEATLDSMRTTGTGSVLAYVCDQVQGGWRCGCSDATCATSHWQVQRYSVPVPEAHVSTNPLPSLTSLTASEATEKEVREAQEKYESLRALYSKEVFDVYSLSNTHAFPGERVTVTGHDFAIGAENTIYLKNQPIGTYASPEGTTLTFTIPSGTVPGFYEVRVARGSKKTPHSVPVWVRDGTAPVPTIQSVSPATGTPDEMFTIRGSGFMKTGNTVITSFGRFENLTSHDGSTLSFTMKDSLFSENTRLGSQTFSLPVQVYVVHAGGISAETEGSVFTLQVR